ncbi:MAG: HlyD family efflux transporter periplasmic adaptor subunit [Pirellulaceae bacterium]
MRLSIKSLIWSIVVLALGTMVLVSMFPEPVAVQAAVATVGSLRVSVQEDGKTRIREKYTVSAPVSGRLSRIELNPGDFITEQTLLAVILPSDPAFLDKRSRAEAQARLQAAQAALSRAQSRVEQARIEAKLSETKLERAEKLLPSSAMSQHEYDIVKSESLAATQAIETAEFDVEIAKFEVKMTQAALDQFSEESANEGVEPFEIHSPIYGRVLRVFEESATVVTVGTPLIEVGDPKNLEIEIDVLSTDAVRIDDGAAVTIDHWGGDRPLRGSVRVVEPGAFTKVSSLGVEEQRVNVIADFNEPAERIEALGDGYRVEASITVTEIDRALTVPNSCLFRHDRRWHVLAIVDGKAVLRDVKTGIQNDERSQILEGLVEGTLVIQYPDDQIQPGDRVRVMDNPSH